MIGWLKGLFGKRPVSAHPSYDNTPQAQRRRSLMRAILRTYNHQPKGIRRGTVEWARFVYVELMAVERLRERQSPRVKRLLERPAKVPYITPQAKPLSEEEWDKATEFLLDAHHLARKVHPVGSPVWAASVLAGLEARGYHLRKDP